MSPRAWVKRRQTATATNVAVTTTTETVVATLSGVSVDRADVRIALEGWVQLQTGAGTTNVSLRVRRGTDTTGTQVGEVNAEAIGAAAGSVEEFSIAVQDTPGEVASQSYVLTVQQTAATANGSALQMSLLAEIGVA